MCLLIGQTDKPTNVSMLTVGMVFKIAKKVDERLASPRAIGLFTV